MASYDSKFSNGEPPAALSEEKIIVTLREMAGRIKRLKFIAVIYLIAVASITYAAFCRWGEVGSIATAISGGLIYIIGFGMTQQSMKNKLKLFFSDNIVKGVLMETFELTEYSPLLHISKQRIKSSPLFKHWWNTISGSDLIEGKYRGVNFSFSDIHLKDVTGSGKKKSSTIIFHGPWLICESGQRIQATLLLTRRVKPNSKKEKNEVETGNADFNKNFIVSTSRPQIALPLLTPNFMEQILKISDPALAFTHMSISGNKIHTALHNKQTDLFEPSIKKIYSTFNIELLRETIRQDVRYITGIMDILLENEHLFKKSDRG